MYNDTEECIIYWNCHVPWNIVDLLSVINSIQFFFFVRKQSIYSSYRHRSK